MEQGSYIEEFGPGDYGGGGGIFDSSDYEYFYGGGGGDSLSPDYVNLPLFDQDPWFAIGSPSGDDPYFDYLDYFLDQGYDGNTADQLAQEAAGNPFQFISSEQGPTQLPNIGPLPNIYVSTPTTPPYIPPYFPLGINLELPPAPKLGPCNTPDGLPKACIGAYWYRSTSDPCECEYFPPSSQQSQQKSQQSKQSSTAASSQSATRQSCPTGYTLNPLTKRCQKVVPCPTGYVFDYSVNRCVLPSQLSNPPGAGSSNNWWWLLALAAGVLVVSDSGGSSPSRGRRRR
jgi:hypothetical protein